MNFEGKKYYDPGVPEVRDYIVAGIEESVRNYDGDGVQFDDYFYPTQGTSIDSVSYQASGSSLAQLDWRRDNINKLVSSVYSATFPLASFSLPEVKTGSFTFLPGCMADILTGKSLALLMA